MSAVPDAGFRKCVRCEAKIPPSPPRQIACPKCFHTCGTLADDEPEFLVLFSLIQQAMTRSVHENDIASGLFLKLQPSQREYVILNHGDEIRVSDLTWRITGKRDGAFWVRCSKMVAYEGNIYPSSPNYDLVGEWKRASEENETARRLAQEKLRQERDDVST